MLDVEVVKAEVAHVDDIMIVENLSFKIPWSRDAFIQEITGNKLAIYLSAKIKDRIVGYAGMWEVCSEGHITNVAVHPEFRGMGIGGSLIRKLIDISKAKDISRMTLEVRKTNVAAQELYSKYGFEISGVRKSYYSDNGEDAIIMWKNNVFDIY